MKNWSFWILGLGVIIAICSIAFPPYQEIRTHAASGRVGAIFEYGYHFVLMKPEPYPPNQGFFVNVQIDRERYVATIALGLALLGAAAFVGSRLRPIAAERNDSKPVKSGDGLRSVISYSEAWEKLAAAQKPQTALHAVPFAWSRLWAKFIDIATYRLGFEVIGLVIFFQFGWSPPYSEHPFVTYVGTGVVFLIVVLLLESLLISEFGTTLGKYLFGISVHDSAGAKPLFAQALVRSFFSYASGCWFLMFFPAVTLVAAFASYKALRESRREASWDVEAETALRFRRMGSVRFSFGVILGVCCLVLLVGTREIVNRAIRSDVTSSIVR
jgi:uncharacterized RDD family membrane protein YckC